MLELLFCHSDKAFYFREIVRFTGLGQGAVQRELALLVHTELIIRQKKGNQVYYQANTGSSLFPEIKSLMTKTGGVAEVLRSALEPVHDRIRVAFVHGSVAKGTETAQSDIDVLVVGDVTFSEVADLIGPHQESLGREINPSVYPTNEFAAKVLAKHHFVTSVIEEPKVFLIGDENEFRRLVEKRLAG